MEYGDFLKLIIIFWAVLTAKHFSRYIYLRSSNYIFSKSKHSEMFAQNILKCHHHSKEPFLYYWSDSQKFHCFFPQKNWETLHTWDTNELSSLSLFGFLSGHFLKPKCQLRIPTVYCTSIRNKEDGQVRKQTLKKIMRHLTSTYLQIVTIMFFSL